MTSRHPRVTKRVFLGGDKNDRVSELTFLSPRPPENHDRPLRRKTTTKTKKRDTIVVAFVFLLTYYLSFSWTTSGRVHNTSVSSELACRGTRVGIASEICKTSESGEGTRVEAVWISRRRTQFGRKPYWTPYFGIFFPASGVFFVVVIVRYWCV